jgi:hypothetical protein
MTGRDGRLDRRGLIKALVGGAGAGLLAAGTAGARPVRKASKARVNYQDHPMDVRACATCTLFLAPDACKVVRGKISPDGWCNRYDLAD